MGGNGKVKKRTNPNPSAMGGKESDKKKKKQAVSASEPEEEYVVEAILDKRMENSKPHYLVKWKDWPHSSNTWEPQSNLRGAPEMLKEFERTFQIKSDVPQKKDTKEPEPNSDSSNYDSADDGTGEAKSNSIDVDVLEECPADKDPEDLLGVVPIQGIMTYLVKWKPKSGSTEDEQDMNLVKGDVFKALHPHVVIAFYEKHIIWTRDERVKRELTNDGMLQLDKSKAKKPDASVYPQKSSIKLSKADGLILGTTVSSDSEDEMDSDEGAQMVPDPTV